MADCKYAETFALIGRVVGAEFGWVELFLVAAVSEMLNVSATHVFVIAIALAVVVFVVVILFYSALIQSSGLGGKY